MDEETVGKEGGGREEGKDGGKWNESEEESGKGSGKMDRFARKDENGERSKERMAESGWRGSIHRANMAKRMEMDVVASEEASMTIREMASVAKSGK